MTRQSKSTISIAALLPGLGMAAWSPASYACAAEPLVASVCIMGADPGVRLQSMNQSYILAAGQTLPLNQYAAPYSLLGITLGGNGPSNFQLPDLRGKAVVGYDPRDPGRAVGANGGSASVKLAVAPRTWPAPGSYSRWCAAARRTCMPRSGTTPSACATASA